jgi:hypothetical protein
MVNLPRGKGTHVSGEPAPSEQLVRKSAKGHLPRWRSARQGRERSNIPDYVHPYADMSSSVLPPATLLATVRQKGMHT